MRGSRPLSVREWRRLKRNFDGRNATRTRCLFELCLGLGTRISELLSLCIDDVWTENGPASMITLSQNVTKARKSRSIPVSKAARQVIRNIVEEKQNRKGPVSPEQPLFEGRDAGHLSRFQAHRILKEAATITSNKAFEKAASTIFESGKVFSELGQLFEDAETATNLEEKIGEAEQKFVTIAEMEEEAFRYLAENVPKM